MIGAIANISIIVKLRARQKTLTVYGLFLLALMVPAFVGQFIDPRMVGGDNVWIKPTKFLFSIAIFALTTAWFFGYVKPERRTAKVMRGTAAVLVIAGSFEILYIVWQAYQGLPSHFNHSTQFHAIMYRLMGVGAVLLVGTTLPIAWEIARRPIAGLRPDYVASVVIGLVLCFLLGGGLGGYMAQQPGHTVGATGGHLPLLGWNRSGGDLRIAHFLGIHAQQAIPLITILLTPLPKTWRWTAVIAGSAIYTLSTLVLFAQAIKGRPFSLSSIMIEASSNHTAPGKLGATSNRPRHSVRPSKQRALQVGCQADGVLPTSVPLGGLARRSCLRERLIRYALAPSRLTAPANSEHLLRSAVA